MHEVNIARWSRYLLYFILAVLPLERIPSLEVASPIHMTIRLSQIAGLILIAINLPTLWRARGKLLHRPWLWLAVFWFSCLLSAGLAVHLKRSVSVLGFTVFVGLMAWVIALRFEREKLNTYFKIIVVSALATCAFGFYQFFGDLLGLPNTWTGLRMDYTKHVFGFPRIQSTGLEPLYFGDFLLIPASLLVLALVNNYKRRLSALALIPIASVVWLTVSRGAIVALAVVLIVGLAAGLWRKRVLNTGLLLGSALISVGLAFGLLYLGTHYVTQTKTEETTHAIENFSKQTTNISNGESSEGRSVTRKLALRAFMSHPVLGIGPGGFGAYAAKEMPERFSGDNAIVNNEPLELLAETGLAGFLSLVAFVCTLMWAAIKTAKSTPVEYTATYGIILALVAIALQYQTFSTLYITHIWVAIGLLGGLAMPHVTRLGKQK